jgi:hypothetical protein
VIDGAMLSELTVNEALLLVASLPMPLVKIARY